MHAAVSTEKKLVTTDDLRDLAQSEGRCVSLLISPHHGGAGTKPIAVRVPAMVAEADARLEALGVLPTERDSLLGPISRLGRDDGDFQSGNSESFVIFRNPERFTVLRLPWETTDQVAVGRRFLLTPLIEPMQAPLDFYLLALARNRVRLLDCGWQRSVEVPLPGNVPDNLPAFTALNLSDRVVNRSPAGMQFGEASERDKLPQRLHDYFVAIDRAVGPMAASAYRPLVLAGTDSELSIYRAASRCATLAPDGVTLSPDGGSSDHELAILGRAALASWRTNDEKNAYRMFETLRGSQRVTADTESIVRAAAQARVEHLFIKPGAQIRGDYRRITGNSGMPGAIVDHEEDLCNAAAVDTLCSSGHVWAGAPARSSMAAVLRY